ncbi:hypothetical protein VCR12J2_640191 [Vibrio coralliirubri]|nr:hypothetical protein VCR12J2_640191 [Vibrio coralliirubri]
MFITALPIHWHQSDLGALDEIFRLYFGILYLDFCQWLLGNGKSPRALQFMSANRVGTEPK